MNQVRYQILLQGGVYDHTTGKTIMRGNPGWNAYQAWLSQGNEPLPPVEKVPSLDVAKEDIKQAIHDYASGLRNKIYAGTSQWESASWAYKFSEALKIIGYGPSTTLANIKAANPRLYEEAEIRGMDVRVLAQEIAAKANDFYSIEAEIAGIAGKHSDAVSKLRDVRDVLFYDWRTGWPEV
ncbi:MAG: hypothetical protein LBI35_00705 [Burkholderiales bacterium]|jgi:hypothetical protein|nr:hypothetical protein [Burkholderiales bacterium]